MQILAGDCRDTLKTLPDQSVHCCVTSPPYFGLRDYGVAGQMGLETTPDAYVAELVAVFREVRRVLRDEGTLFLNLGDSYAGSGRGGNPDAGTKQGTNKGSQTVGVLHGLDQSNAAAERARMKDQFIALKGGGLKQKDLIGIPWMVAFALRADGWYLRQDIIWHKPNPMPESVTDRCTKAHEYIFMLSKSARYFYDQEAIKEAAVAADPGEMDGGAQRNPNGSKANSGRNYRDKQRGHSRRHAGFNDRWDKMERTGQCSGVRNKRSVWTVATQPFKEAHFATFPPALIEPCILAGCPKGGTVLDPFGGAGTTGLVADRLQRKSILIELNQDYVAMAYERFKSDAPLFAISQRDG